MPVHGKLVDSAFVCYHGRMNIETLFKDVPELLKGKAGAADKIWKRPMVIQNGLWMLALVAMVSALGQMAFPESLSDVLLIRPSGLDAAIEAVQFFIRMAGASILMAYALQHFKRVSNFQSVAGLFMHMHAVLFLMMVPSLSWVAWGWLIYLQYKFIERVSAWEKPKVLGLIFAAHGIAHILIG